MQYKPTSQQNFSPEEGASQERTGPEPGTLVIEDLTLRHGFIQIPRLLLFARNVSRDAKILYAILLGYAWQEGRCFPGYSKLCEDMQASENMVRKYMRELEEVEIIAQKRRGLGKTNIYTIRDLRTSKIEVQEHNKTEVTEHRKSDVKLETEELETEELKNSNIRMATAEKKRVETDENKQRGVPSRQGIAGTSSLTSPSSSAPSSSAIPRSLQGVHKESSRGVRGEGGFSTIGDSIARSKAGRPPKMYDEDRQIILEYIEDFAREFSDQAPLKSSTSRAYKLFQQSGLEVGAFIARMQQARSVTKESSAQIKSEVREEGRGGSGGGGSRGNSVYPLKRKMAYFFAVLEDQLGLREADKGKKGQGTRDSAGEATGEGSKQGEEGHEGEGYRPRYFGSGS